MIQVDIDNDVTEIECPPDSSIEKWVTEALAEKRTESSVAIKIIDEAEMLELNQSYRQKPKTTNVLSFPTQLPEPIRGDFIGDIAICAHVVQQEATEQGITFEAHFAHLVVHGVLHLLGYDHQTEAEAAVMENEETQILRRLGFNDPYLVEITHE